MTESGKGHWLRALFLRSMPRVLTVDPNGEMQPLDGLKVWRAYSLDEVRASLALAVKSTNRWQVIAQLAPSEFPALAQMLVPNVVREGRAFPLLCGGMTLDVQELDLVAGMSVPPEVHSLWARSRHVGLSICGASQRPHRVAVVVRSQSRFHLVCRQDEPADIAYLRAYFPGDAHAILGDVPWHWCLIYDKRRAVWSLVDENGKVKRSGGSAQTEGLTP